jgi:hypothetical protein
MTDLYKNYWNNAPDEGELLREIANDKLTPKNKTKKNTDGLYEVTDVCDNCGMSPCNPRCINKDNTILID